MKMLRLAVVLVLGVLAQQIFADEPEAIVGGSSASSGEFPHQVSLRYEDSHICGASIITPTKILTAAHCVYGLVSSPYDDFEVVTGTIDNHAGNTHRVKDVHVHPEYVHDISHAWVNDIAVITLHSPIQFSRFQTPIPLASSPPQPGTTCTLSGWGKTKTNGYASRFLMKMYTALVDNETCQRYHDNLPIHQSHLCAFTGRGVGACQGDSGGPLICGGQQYGIVSFVLPCAVGAPDVYTSVYHQLDFIDQCIAEN